MSDTEERVHLGPVARPVLPRPDLWVAALAQAWRLRRRGWWRRWPPTPDPALWRWRMQSAYGGVGDAEPTPDDVVSFLRWCRGMRQWRRR